MAARIQQTEFEKPGDTAPARPARTAAISECTRGHSLRAWIVSDCSTFLPPFTAGGTERQLSDLARQLELCGAEVTLVMRASPNSPAGALPTEDGLRTQFVPPAPIPKGMGWAALGPNIRYITGTFQRLLRARREYDVLIVSGFKQLGLPIALLARLVGKPCLVRIDAAWDLDDELSPESTARLGWQARGLASATIRASRRAAFRLAHGVVAFSDPLEHRLLALGAAPRKIKRIPNGIDTGRFAPAAREEKIALRRALGLPTDRTIFIYTGRICRAKGLLELMNVWERLADRRLGGSHPRELRSRGARGARATPRLDRLVRRRRERRRLSAGHRCIHLSQLFRSIRALDRRGRRSRTALHRERCRVRAAGRAASRERCDRSAVRRTRCGSARDRMDARASRPVGGNGGARPRERRGSVRH